MQPSARGETNAFASLPLELFLQVLDELVGTHNGQYPIAYASANPLVQALRALTLVSKSTYTIASRYLYEHCVYLNTRTKYARFRRTLGLPLGYHPHALGYGQAGRNERLFQEADVLRYVTSVFVSPEKSGETDRTPIVQLPQIIDLFQAIGPTLRRLAMDLQPVYAPGSEIQRVKPHTATNNIFLNMPRLEELVCSYDVTDYFPVPPPNLKRLAMTFLDLDEAQLDFCFSISSVEMLCFLRPAELDAMDIEELFSRYKGRLLDIVLVSVNVNHRTPSHSRDWKDDDHVRLWEVDVPTSYYGDDGDIVLCDGWIWSHGVLGTLWDHPKRRMESWSEIERRLAA